MVVASPVLAYFPSAAPLSEASAFSTVAALSDDALIAAVATFSTYVPTDGAPPMAHSLTEAPPRIDADWTGRTINGIPVVANEENAAMYVCQEWIDEVLICLLYTSDNRSSEYTVCLRGWKREKL